jgi:ATP-dependent RNA helicase SUPV3L1/SUV3
LDQPARATLRKYGVRFGGYHIYVPALLKPAPRILAAQLWALKNAAPDAKGLDELQHLAAGGRTSIPIDKEIAKPFYRIVGYRVCGERAVRVDILERLADLIRPALAWREGSLGVKPPGAVDGSGFTATQAMTSLTGASGEDFASILRSLGYRSEKRPKPAEPAPVTEAPAPADTAVAEPAQPVADASAEASEVPIPVMAAPVIEEAAGALEAPAAEAAPVEPSMDAASAPAETVPAETPMNATAVVEEFIEVWRPGRPSERHRRPASVREPRRDRNNRQRPGEAQPAAAASPPADATPAQPGEATSPQERKPRPHRGERQGKRPDQRQDRPPRQGRQDRPHRPKRENERPAFEGRGSAERRDKVADPNSPFAKLAALKAQLEADAKERRIRSCPPERPANRCRQPAGARGRCDHRGARPRGADPEGRRLCRTARRCGRWAGALCRSDPRIAAGGGIPACGRGSGAGGGAPYQTRAPRHRSPAKRGRITPASLARPVTLG